MVTRTVKVLRATGLQVKAAGAICDEAVRYSSHIIFRNSKAYEGNLKSMLSILGAGVKASEEITVVCSGPDEQEALENICAIIEGVD